MVSRSGARHSPSVRASSRPRNQESQPAVSPPVAAEELRKRMRALGDGQAQLTEKALAGMLRTIVDTDLSTVEDAHQKAEMIKAKDSTLAMMLAPIVRSSAAPRPETGRTHVCPWKSR